MASEQIQHVHKVWIYSCLWTSCSGMSEVLLPYVTFLLHPPPKSSGKDNLVCSQFYPYNNSFSIEKNGTSPRSLREFIGHVQNWKQVSPVLDKHSNHNAPAALLCVVWRSTCFIVWYILSVNFMEWFLGLVLLERCLPSFSSFSIIFKTSIVLNSVKVQCFIDELDEYTL